ncbi:HAD family phosphatase [Parasalinivibrio latis]|uniref:HAD family hydrolase n=1 Tax=Parasalinivibrio latis TaxID=2952610 RepID=UPI0030E11DFD
MLEPKTVVAYDLDDTLLKGDSSILWNRFVYQSNLVSSKDHLDHLSAFKSDYHKGILDCQAYQKFTMSAFRSLPEDILVRYRERFFEQEIKPRIKTKSIDLVSNHRSLGYHTVLISATNAFITEPVKRFLNIDADLSTEPERIGGMLTGNFTGTASFKEGKRDNFIRYMEKLKRRGEAIGRTRFYSDSHNDIPLLSYVDEAIAVNPDNVLNELAKKVGWEIISLDDYS